MVELLQLPAEMQDFSGATLIYADPPYKTGRDFGEFNDKWKDDEYYEFMRYWLQRVKDTAGDTYNLVVHIDPKTSHYTKVLADEIFGAKNFQNEIIWQYRSGGVGKRNLAKKHDVLLWYGMGDYTFNILREPYSTIGKTGPYWHPDGRMLTDVWDISMISTTGLERVGYPTQKPEKLLDRIITIFSNEGDLVIDPFLGSGTTAAVASKLGRKFRGGDINQNAIDITKTRLEKK